MKRLAVSLLSSFVLLTAGHAALAAGNFRPNPFQLVNLAYEGRYQAEGIPSHLILEQDYTSARVRPNDVIEAAVQAGDLPATTLQDSHYVNAVRLQMRSLKIDNHRYLQS
ncbi:MAG: hypothetical protein WA949_12975 [Phormidesmis sp.]